MIQNNRYELKQTHEHICVGFSTEHPVLSSAVFNGGACHASNILIMKVAENFEDTKQIVENPENILAEYCRQLQLSGTTVGMMTSASMDSFRRVSRSSQGVEISAIVTAGVSNARCAGDRADRPTHVSARCQSNRNHQHHHFNKCNDVPCSHGGIHDAGHRSKNRRYA